MVSIDGVHFRIMEPSLFNPKWYSHKFHGPGLRYDLAICIRTGNIVWASGGLPCGEWSDLRLARDVFIFGLREERKPLPIAVTTTQTFFIFLTETMMGRKNRF